MDADRIASITAAFAQVTSSLRELAINDDRGRDLLATLVMMLGGSTNGAPAVAIEVPTDAEITRRSHELIDALDRGDTDTVDALLAPDFFCFDGGHARDRDVVFARIRNRPRKASFIATRTWDDERVARRGNTIAFTGMAHEVQGGNDTHGGYLYDGWYLVQWVLRVEGWRVQLVSWQKASTEPDVWNETFRMGRGFSKDPNRLLVDTIKDIKPGTALDLATGQGRNALCLAARGWNVTGVDHSDDGLRIAREQALARGLALETICSDIDAWDFGEGRFDLVTLLYAGDHGKWIDKIKTSLRSGGLLIVEGWAKQTPDSPVGFGEGQLAPRFDGYEILRDEIVDDVPDWGWDQGRLVRFVARKR